MRSDCLAQLSIEDVFLCRDTNNHQLQICGSAIYEGMRFVKADRNGIALMDRCRFIVDSNLTVPVEHVVDLFDALVAMQSVRCSGGNQKMIHIGPVR